MESCPADCPIADAYEGQLKSLKAENERLRKLAGQMLHAHMLAVARVGIRPDHPLASSNEEYREAMMEACDQWKKELESTTSAGTSSEGV